MISCRDIASTWRRHSCRTLFKISGHRSPEEYKTTFFSLMALLFKRFQRLFFTTGFLEIVGASTESLAAEPSRPFPAGFTADIEFRAPKKFDLARSRNLLCVSSSFFKAPPMPVHPFSDFKKHQNKTLETGNKVPGIVLDPPDFLNRSLDKSESALFLAITNASTENCSFGGMR